MFYIRVNDTDYPSVEINGRLVDYDWDNRDSKSITMEMTADEIKALFPDNAAWAIVEKTKVPSGEVDSDGSPIMVDSENVWDNSEYSLSGEITDHRNGKVTIKMGKLTDLEEAYKMLIGG